jgi:hypothetical protein
MSFGFRRHDYHGKLEKSHAICQDVRCLFHRAVVLENGRGVVDANLVSVAAQDLEVA